MQARILDFNAVIIKESESRGLKVVDVFKLSQDMGRDQGLVGPDGLHPSAREHALWENLICPVAKQLLK